MFPVGQKEVIILTRTMLRPDGGWLWMRERGELAVTMKASFYNIRTTTTTTKTNRENTVAASAATTTATTATTTTAA